MCYGKPSCACVRVAALLTATLFLPQSEEDKRKKRKWQPPFGS
jgi:hypothetical protein